MKTLRFGLMLVMWVAGLALFAVTPGWLASAHSGSCSPSSEA